jgi:8-oxo-dGTP diphosphatase
MRDSPPSLYCVKVVLLEGVFVMGSRIGRLVPSRVAVYLWKKLPIPKRIRSKIMWHVNDRFLAAVLGLIQNEKNEILLLHHTYRSEPWGVPSGWLEYEDPLKGLEREIYEETGLTITASQVLNVTYAPHPHRMDIYCVGQFLDGEFKKSAEISQYGFFHIGNLPEGLSKYQRGFIVDFLQNKSPNR